MIITCNMLELFSNKLRLEGFCYLLFRQRYCIYLFGEGKVFLYCGNLFLSLILVYYLIKLSGYFIKE